MFLLKKYDLLTYIFLLCFITVPVIASSENAALMAQHYGYFSFSAALCISLTAASGAISQSMAAQTALTGIARNPEAADKIFIPMILSLALIESLVLFSLVIAFLIVGKIA